MPIFHQYQDKSGWFVRTSIQKAIITYQLTAAGALRLLEAGIKDGARFRRAVLFELYRTGDAFTHGTGPGIIEPKRKGQMELDFANDPDPETIFPRCSSCSSLNDLHFVEIKDERVHYASLLCPPCRKVGSSSIDTSVPLWLVDRKALGILQGLKGIKELDNVATGYKESLDRAFKEKWEKLTELRIQRKQEAQDALFERDEKQKKLI